MDQGAHRTSEDDAPITFPLISSSDGEADQGFPSEAITVVQSTASEVFFRSYGCFRYRATSSCAPCVLSRVRCAS